jgi:hypothetical protein
MRLKSLVGLLLLIFAVSCVPAKIRIADRPRLEAKLIERANEFQTYYYGNKPEIIWDKFLNKSTRKKYENNKENYIKYYEGNKHMREFHNVEYLVEMHEIRNNKAKVKVTYNLRSKKDSDVIKAVVYDYWEYEKGDWFFSFTGKPEFSEIEGL